MKVNLYEISYETAQFNDRLWPRLWAYFNEFRNEHLRNPTWLRISRNDWQIILTEDADMEHMDRLVTGSIAIIVDPNVRDGMPSFE